MSETRTTHIRFVEGPWRGWRAEYPSGRYRYWYYRQVPSFNSWVMSFLRRSRDVVVVHYALMVHTYTFTSGKEESHE